MSNISQSKSVRKSNFYVDLDYVINAAEDQLKQVNSRRDELESSIEGLICCPCPCG